MPTASRSRTRCFSFWGMLHSKTGRKYNGDRRSGSAQGHPEIALADPAHARRTMRQTVAICCVRPMLTPSRTGGRWNETSGDGPGENQGRATHENGVRAADPPGGRSAVQSTVGRAPINVSNRIHSSFCLSPPQPPAYRKGRRGKRRLLFVCRACGPAAMAAFWGTFVAIRWMHGLGENKLAVGVDRSSRNPRVLGYRLDRAEACSVSWADDLEDSLYDHVCGAGAPCGWLVDHGMFPDGWVRI